MSLSLRLCLTCKWSLTVWSRIYLEIDSETRKGQERFSLDAFGEKSNMTLRVYCLLCTKSLLSGATYILVLFINIDSFYFKG